MFTGIVRELGAVEGVEESATGVRLLVRAPETAAAAAVGDSVAVNGVCLTASSPSTPSRRRCDAARSAASPPELT